MKYYDNAMEIQTFVRLTLYHVTSMYYMSRSPKHKLNTSQLSRARKVQRQAEVGRNNLYYISTQAHQKPSETHDRRLSCDMFYVTLTWIV